MINSYLPATISRQFHQHNKIRSLNWNNMQQVLSHNPAPEASSQTCTWFQGAEVRRKSTNAPRHCNPRLIRQTRNFICFNLVYDKFQVTKWALMFIRSARAVFIGCWYWIYSVMAFQLIFQTPSSGSVSSSLILRSGFKIGFMVNPSADVLMDVKV